MSAYQEVLTNVRRIAESVGRDPEKITVLAVSKNHSLEEIHLAYQAGCRDFGESRVQEALKKIGQAPNDIRWHLIGTLQKNKVSKVVGKFVLIHSVDSLELAQKLSASSRSTSILLQVNTSGEISKAGLSCDEWRSQIIALQKLPNLKIEGLMTMAPLTHDTSIIRKAFASLRHFRDELEQAFGLSLPHLSMGMSNDYPIAIEEGATILRIGTAIFESQTS